jgi:hypothetical protein
MLIAGAVSDSQTASPDLLDYAVKGNDLAARSGNHFIPLDGLVLGPRPAQVIASRGEKIAG